MKHKTCILLTGISFVLRALALLEILIVTVFQGSFKRIYSVDKEVAAIQTIPWNFILQGLFWLVFTGIVLLILVKKPGRDGTVILTILSAMLFTLDSAVLSILMNDFIMRAAAGKGVVELASASALSNVMSRLLSFLNTPATILFFLGLGGACGKDFQKEL